MPFVFCEVCDYMGRGRTPQDRLLDVIRHEEKEHNRCDIEALLLYEQSLKEEE